MERTEFAAAYTDTDYTPETINSPEVEELLEAPRYWAGFFDDLMTDYLTGAEINFNQVNQQLVDYIDWWHQDFKSTYTKMVKTVSGAKNPHDSLSLIQELNFHLTAQPMIMMWPKLISDGEYQIPNRSLNDIQTLLAIDAADLARDRKLLKHTEDKAGARSQLVGILNGQLTEIDTAVTLIELMKEDPEGALVVVPAPPRYESSTQKRNNADFLLVDTKLHQVRGIQTKTRLGGNDEKRTSQASQYSRVRITLIDGVADLGNSVGVLVRKTTPHPHTENQIQAAPGLISMDHLQRISITKDIPFGDPRTPEGRHAIQSQRGTMMRAKSIARELSGHRKSFIRQATAQVKQKVIHDLYMTLPEEAEISAS